MNKEDIGKLAIEVSKKCRWAGDDICAVFLEALTDANFHTLREKLEPIINNALLEDALSFQRGESNENI